MCRVSWSLSGALEAPLSVPLVVWAEQQSAVGKLTLRWCYIAQKRKASEHVGWVHKRNNLVRMGCSQEIDVHEQRRPHLSLL